MFGGNLFGGQRPLQQQQQPQVNLLIADRRWRYQINYKYLLKLRKEKKTKEEQENGGESQSAGERIFRTVLNHLKKDSLQRKLLSVGLERLWNRGKQTNLSKNPSRYKFGEYCKYRLEPQNQVKGQEPEENLPKEKSDQEADQDQVEDSDAKIQAESEFKASIAAAYESRLDGDQELINKGIQEEFVFSSGEEEAHVGLTRYLEHAYQVIISLRVPILNPSDEDDHDELNRLIQTYQDLEVLFRELWNREGKTRQECLTLLAYSLHLIKLNQLCQPLTQFMSDVKANRGLGDLIVALMRESESQVIKEAIISFIYDLQQRVENPYLFNAFLLKQIGKELSNLIRNQKWNSEDSFMHLLEIIEDIVVSQMFKPDPERAEDENNEIFIYTMDREYVDLLSQTIFWVFSSRHRFDEESQQTADSIIEELYRRQDDLNEPKPSHQSKKESKTKNEPERRQEKEFSTKIDSEDQLLQRTDQEDEEDDMELIDSGWTDTEGSEDIEVLCDLDDINHTPEINERLLRLFYLISIILKNSYQSPNSFVRRGNGQENLNLPEASHSLAAKFETELIKLISIHQESGSLDFNQEILEEFLKQTEELSQANLQENYPFLYASKIVS